MTQFLRGGFLGSSRVLVVAVSTGLPMLHTVLFSNEELLLLRREVAPPQLVLTNPSENFFSAFKRERHRGEGDFGMFLNDFITVVSINKGITPDNQRRNQLALFEDIFFKLLKFIIGQRGNLRLELRVDFQIDHTHTPLSLLLRLFFLPEKGRNILLCGFQFEQFLFSFLVLLVELCLFGCKLRTMLVLKGCMAIHLRVCYTQKNFFSYKGACKMNSERLMNEKRLALLKTIRKENLSLRRYMNDIINEMENPQSAFNTGRVTNSSDLDRQTVMRLCDAFVVAKEYSEKYHLDFPELIEFVSEKTLELVIQNKANIPTFFKRRMEGLIREQFPFQNALLSRESQINKSFYDKYDEQESFNEKKQNHYDLPVELMLPILFTNNANASYSGIEFVPERAEKKEKIEIVLKSLDIQEADIIRWRFGLDDGESRTLEEVGEILGRSREYVRLREAKAIRKLHSRKCLLILGELLNFSEICNSPIGRGIIIKRRNKYSKINSFDILCWQPYCTCKHQMRYRVPVSIDGKWKTVFYCQNCGRIYEVKNRKLKRIPWYCLKGYTLDSSLDKEWWPIVHWDTTKGRHREIPEFASEFQ